MPVVLSDRDYLALKEHMRQTSQEVSNLKNRIAGATRNWARGGSSLAPIYTPFYNDSGEAVPSKGVMRITNATTDGYLICAKPNSVFTGLYLINCGRDVRYQGKGYGSFLMGDTPCWSDRLALYNTAATPSPGQSFGVLNNSWLLHQHGPGFIILGSYNATKGTVAVIQIPPSEILIYNAGSAVAAGTSGSFQVHGGAAGSEADSGLTITAFNRMSVEFGSGKYGAAGALNGQGYAVRYQV